ncbi:hypothetical protein I3760_12G138800 [Carya illinoinensis]|uniref:proteasome activator subunit 4-like isoform X2 n=1 Tax=Carya illinoinensis TaxID=32201 RepID=UPI001BF25C7F|nr:proteasome activator subunit 4-like isoform X2 [Carya illinoinensis]KAG2678329.1 hypothetical protein I3760_12G138800 [Carya illinoinensis]
MHLYNAWLPPPVAEQTKREKESFSRLVRTLEDFSQSDEPDSVYSTLTWIPRIKTFMVAESDVALEDVGTLVKIGLEFFEKSQNKLYAQVKWGKILVLLLSQYRKKLSLKIQWRPLYDALIINHFTRNTGPEGPRLKQHHFETITSLVQSCRRFFPPGSASEIWSEFRSLVENPWHNSSFEGSGFLRLFLPTNLDNWDFFSCDRIKQWIDLWDSIPNCHFWNCQWAGVIARVIKNCKFVNWECFLPTLFIKYLNMFEVPVANRSESHPFPMDVPKNIRFLFSNNTVSLVKAIAKSIVYLLKPRSAALAHLEKIINLLEQYYHPSNGGSWTYSLACFLIHLVIQFQKRLKYEQQNINNCGQAELYLGRSERKFFVNVVLKLIDRGQYSKNNDLSATVAAAISRLSYVEPSLVLPFVASRYYIALETMTATHQLEIAVKSISFVMRSLLLTSLSPSSIKLVHLGGGNEFIDLLTVSLSNALLGLDANDPPKTLATMKLIASIFSNLDSLDDDVDVLSFMPIRFSQWLDEFLSRLFCLLLYLEPSSVLNEGLYSPATSGTFLCENHSYYYCMLEILLGRLSESLYDQALRKISKFVKTNTLPGSSEEVGLLCCACVHSNQEEGVNKLIEPLLLSVLSSLDDTPVMVFEGEISTASMSIREKPTLSPALETTISSRLKVLSIAISYGGPALLHYKDQFKEAILSSFDSPSWKVNKAGNHLLQSLLKSLTHYYPADQYNCMLRHPGATTLDKWISTKYYSNDELAMAPKWHIPSDDEVQFANELLDLHLQSALDDLYRICQASDDSDPGDKKEHLKVLLLRINSSLQGVLSCLPDFNMPSSNAMVEDPDNASFLIAGAMGSSVGSTELREKAANIIHAICKYLLLEKADDSILLTLVIHITDALVNYGNYWYDQWSGEVWDLDSAAIIEPPINFIALSHSRGKKRPRWDVIDKAYLHSMWRSFKSFYHKFCASGKFYPSSHVIHLIDDLLKLCLHNYETIRRLAGKSLLKIFKRWPSIISKCILSLTENLQDPNSSEHAVLGSCAILASKAVFKHLAMDPKSLSSFILGILSSSHHESLEAQKAINELFVAYNIYYAGVSRSIFRMSDDQIDGKDFANLVSKIVSMGSDSISLHWRYNLMANRVLLLLAMTSRNYLNSSSKMLRDTAGHFLKNLKCKLPQTRILAISALNTLLTESPYKLSMEECPFFSDNFKGKTRSSLERALTQIFQEDGFFNEALNSLALVHIITDVEGTSSGGNQGSSIFQSEADKSITRFYFEFSASWPRTPCWISFLESNSFHSKFARIFKRLVQECGMSVLLPLKSTLEEFANAKERSKQCVAAEAFAGILHSDVNGTLVAWDSWMMVLLQNIILAQSVESIPEWAACIRYAVGGKGRYGTRIPLLRQQILDCLAKPLPPKVTTTVVAKRYTFLSAALIELSPQKMPVGELQLHNKLLQELLGNMCHSSAQVREAVGVTLSVLCSNIRLYAISDHHHSREGANNDVNNRLMEDCFQILTEKASHVLTNIQNASHCVNLETSRDISAPDVHLNGDSQDNVKWMETVAVPFYHLIFEVWKIFMFTGCNCGTPLSCNFFAGMASYRGFLLHHVLPNYIRHTFIFSRSEKQKIWRTVEKLLVDIQVEVREHAATVLADLMKGVDEDQARHFLDRAYNDANALHKKRKKINLNDGQAVASIHGTVLALAASVLSAPYDMPSWLPEHVTLLARFGGEPSPVKSTVTKAVAEFRRTHADTWDIQKNLFTEEQLEILADTSSSSSYFA